MPLTSRALVESIADMAISGAGHHTNSFRADDTKRLLEATLPRNLRWQIIGALHCLHHQDLDRLKSIASILTRDTKRGSNSIRRVARGRVEDAWLESQMNRRRILGMVPVPTVMLHVSGRIRRLTKRHFLQPYIGQCALD